MQLIICKNKLGVLVLLFMLVRLIPSIKGPKFLPTSAYSWISIVYVQN